ncbi:MAG TPA: Hsp70 family protein [Thermoanaerobaculia bacterium]|jgi:molecular chaperone DnaK|nr:Hsp70 family protein [Thermoanaerobaculia bacterium]
MTHVTKKIFGIDLGTTNSCLAVMEDGGPRVIAIEGEPIVPSVVGLDRHTGRFLVGRRARNRQVLEPAWTVRSIKRRMGETARVRLGDRELLPEEVSAEILRYLKEQGEAALGEPVERAVITVPAYFGDAQRRATIRAGELAGLEVVRILNEPTAAALVYDRLVARKVEPQAVEAVTETPEKIEPAVPDRHAGAGVQRVLVYDLGGGTFDVSVVEIGGGINEVRASCGNNQLGGDDFDRLLADHLAARLRERTGRDLPQDLRLRARLEEAAERAKVDLSSRPFARVMEEALVGGFHLDLEVDRQSFETLIDGLLASTLAEVDQALSEARLTAKRIDLVILVGGSTHIPRVRELLAGRFSCPVEHAVDPALCVALGAAVQGAILAGQVFDHILVDVAAHSLGIKTLDHDSGFWGPPQANHFSTIIRRNTQVPVTRSEIFKTLSDDQKNVQVEVYQGESPRCSENTLVGRFPFKLLPAPAGSPVVVEFRYDLDGVIRVVVHQKGTDNRQEVTLSTRTRETAAAGSAGAVENYILRKARAVAAGLPAGELRERLAAAAESYEEVLANAEAGPGNPGKIDTAEEQLLEVLEEAEEAKVGP